MSTYTPIASQTLSSAASSVTFSGIPQGYTDLILVSCDLTTSSTGNTHYIQFNSDTSAKYSNTWLYGTGSVAGSSRTNTASGYNEIFIGSIQVGASATTPEVSIAHIMNYSNNTTYKTVLVRTGDASNEATANVGLWQSTSAITSIVVGRTGGTYASGSTFSLYGIQAGTPKAQGGQIVTTDGTYWYHAFTASGTFTPSSAISADVLVVAGGGSGGGIGTNNWGYGGGGGAGGLVYSSSQSLSANTPYSCVIGAGGFGANGNNSTFNGTSATGGGMGGYYSGSAYLNGAVGGSGGGGGTSNASTGGSGTSGQGNAGGNGDGTNNNGGGGGGAGGAGYNGNAGGSVGGVGGVGSSTYSSFGLATNTGQNVSGTVYFAGGGGGMRGTGGTGTGGNGGGGAGSTASGSAGTSGTVNTGGGGGGAFAGSSQTPGTGGSGVVIIRYAV